MDLLVWWSQNCTVYPKLAVLARRLLACQAT
jgi:hypothetical protein